MRPGVLTTRVPTSREETDIEFGWDLAKKMGELDVGQSVACKERAVLAVEAIEAAPTAASCNGEFCKAGGFVVVKVAKPQQDMRFDVPTVAAVRRSKRCTVLAAASSLLKPMARQLSSTSRRRWALANRYGIAIVTLHGHA